MVKINNWDIKASIIICIVLISLVFTVGIIVFFIIEQWWIASFSIPIGGIAIYITIKGNWPETIVFDEEKIVVYRLGKEINKISWHNVKEIYRRVIHSRHRLNCYYYFSDGEDGFLDVKDGNDHFIVFKCPRNQEYIFSKFTELPVKELESENL